MEIRNISPKDYSRLALIFNTIYPYYTYTEENIRYKYEEEGKMINLKAFVAEINNEVVAIAEYYKSQFKSFKNGDLFEIGIYVDPRYQRRGIGNKLYDFILKEIEKENADGLMTYVLGSHIDSINFLIKRGFFEIYRYYELELNLERINLDKMYIKDLDVEIVSLKEEKDLNKLNLYELIKSISKDIPSALPFEFPSFERWKSKFFKNPYIIYDSFFIAKKNGKYVGFSSLYKENEEVAKQGLTGVIKEYRNKGIAKALKLKVIKYAKIKGFKKIRTWNGCSNFRILTLNRNLGFELKRDWIMFYKDLK